MKSPNGGSDRPVVETEAAASRIRIDVRHRVVPESEELADIHDGLSADPPWISSKYFYDEVGSLLFDRICELPEYYPTRAENEILARTSDEIVAVAGASELLEFGSGMSTKTRHLLDAMQRAGRLERYLPFEVSEPIVRRVADELAREYPGLEVHAVVGDFTTTLDYIPPAQRRLAALIGGTIGNFPDDEAVRLLTEARARMSPGEHFLLGTDLVKDRETLEAAYNDSQGLTARFNRNILNVLNRKLDANFDPAAFEHVAFYDEEHRWIEMRLRASSDQIVGSKRLGTTYRFARGCDLQTEISTKYDRDSVADLLSRSGFRPVAFYTDSANLFGLSLALRSP